ncbi:MAG: aminoglycoside phosphotransferase family protein [Novosphingobium sp.]|nr:aminoglycoside phosphotransferase family protein [Novosphingobium sp.]
MKIEMQMDLQAEVPATLERVLDPAWVGAALGKAVARVESVEVLRTVATKVRFAVEFADGSRGAYCLKGLLDVDEMTSRGGPTMVREADFYGKVAAHVDVRVPTCVTSVIDRERQHAVVIMRDLIADGARFCTALEPFTADEAAASLELLARLHAGRGLLAGSPWIDRRVDQLAEARYVSAEQLQQMLDGPRGEGLPAITRDAGRLIAAIRALAARDAARPQFLVHGDCHAGNIFRTGDGHGLIDWQLLQSGGWALDVAYHIAAVLPVELAEREERNLLGHYLVTMQALGCEMPCADEAWRQYRESAIYGFYLWAITRRVDAPIIVAFVQRLGASVTRHASHALLGIA